MAVLYRKYRSKSLDELVGQDHITTALKRSMASGNISHAYLFTGPRGTGKTSVARILAYELNNLPYDESATHLDIIEIDAASNRRIDEIRDLRDKVHIAPTSAKYKVYIIDEVHMLTKEAFNALLKTLEEPPAHVIFILATTELHKVPETIISRTQRFSFKPIEKQKIMEHLAYIARQEGIQVDDDALALIAEHSEGGFRDAISLLDQVSNTAAKVSADSVLESIGSPSSSKISVLWEALRSGSPDTKDHLFALLDQGYHAPLIARSLLKIAVDSRSTALARKILDASSSHDPRTELLLLTMEQDTSRQAATLPKVVEPAPTKVTPKAESAPVEKVTLTSEEPKPADKEKATPISSDTSFDKWDEVLQHIKDAGHAVYGPLRLAQASVHGSTVRLGLTFPFHIKRVNEAKNLQAVTATINEVSGGNYNVEVYRVEQGSESVAPPASVATALPKVDLADEHEDSSLMSDPLSIVKNVFGDAQVL